MSEAEKKGRAMLSAVGQSISDDTMVGVEKSIGDAQRNMAVNLNQTVDNFNNFSSAYSAYSSDYELNVAGQLNGYRATQANTMKAQANLGIQDLKHQSAVNAQARAQTSVANAQRYADRTDAFRQQNPVYQAPAGIMDGVDVKGNLAWADQQRAKHEQSWINQVNQEWSEAENNHPLLKQVFGRQSSPQTVVDAAYDFLTSAATATGVIGNSSSSVSRLIDGKRIVTTFNPLASPTVPMLGVGQHEMMHMRPTSSYNLAKTMNVLSSSARTGGLIGAAMAPIGTVLEYGMDDNKNFNSQEFKIDLAYNTSKGVLSGTTGAYVGAAVTAALIVTAPATVAVTAGVAAGIAIGAGISYAVDGFRDGVNHISTNWF